MSVPNQPARSMTRHSLRAAMPVATDWAYLDHAAVGPLPQVARDAIVQWADESARGGDTFWPQWSRRIEQIRGIAAGLLGADRAEVAFAPSTTQGLSWVAEGFPWRAGDNLVTLDNEFPSNLYPWLHLRDQGIEVRRVPTVRGRVELAEILRACDRRTRLVSVSWVGYASGWRLDLAALVHEVQARGALVCLDAIQGLGVFPLDVRAIPVDFLAADGHKWLLGPEGAGLFYLRRQHLELLRPVGVGWRSVAQPYEFDRIADGWRADAARYEGGSHNTSGILALGASLELLLQHGAGPRSTILAERVLEVAGHARCQLSERLGAEMLYDDAPEHRSGIVTFRLPGRDAAELRAACLARQVVLSCRGGGLRASFHAYNDQADIDRLVAALT